MPRQNQIQFRKGTSSQWTDNNPVLASGEPGYESDSNRLKIGVGLNWDDTSYISADSLITTVYNKTNSTISGFSVVYISGGQGNLPAISPSIATTDSTSANTYGITVSNIPTNSSGLVITNGLLKNVNTNKFGTNKEGSSLWLSPTVSGDLTLAKPYAPYHAVFVGTIVRSHNTQGVVEVKIQNGYELEELHDVAVTGVVNGQFLQYNTASGLWIPSSSGNFSTLSVNNNPVYHSGILPNPVIGVGISGYLSKWINNSGVSSGIIFDNGTNIGIGTATPSRNLHVIGTGLFDSLNIGGTPLGGISIPFFTRSTTNSTSSSILFIENTSYNPILDVRGDGNVAIGNVGGAGLSHRLVVKGSTSNSSVAALSVINSGNTSILFARNDGNVGIGTASPLSRLHITSTGNNDTILEYTNSTAGFNSGVVPLKLSLTAANGAAVGAGVGLDLVTRANSIEYIGGRIQTNRTDTSNNHALTFWAGGGTTPLTEYMRIGSNGNVGIGTASPSEKLEIDGFLKFVNCTTKIGRLDANNVSFATSSSTIGHYGILIDNTATANGKKYRLASWADGTTAKFIIRDDSSGVDRFVIDNAGNVGIGTATPGYKLQINGSFGATTKSFRIDHPSKKGYSLEYGSLESPYHGVRLTGRGKVSKGVGSVDLPDYLKDLIHDDESVVIQLTNHKHGKTLYVDKIDLQNDRFIVKADRAKTLGELEFFWSLTGTRKDVENLVAEKEN